MAKQPNEQTHGASSSQPAAQTLPGMEGVGKLPADLVRATIHRRLTLRDALPDDPEFKKNYRFLWEWMSFTDVSDEKAKERSTLIVKIAEGAWSIAMTDASMAATLAVSGPTLHGCLERLDELLGDPDAPWVPSRKKEARLKDRKKK